MAKGGEDGRRQNKRTREEMYVKTPPPLEICDLLAFRSNSLYMSFPGNDDDPSSLSRKKVFFICSPLMFTCQCVV